MCICPRTDGAGYGGAEGALRAALARRLRLPPAGTALLLSSLEWRDTKVYEP